MLDDRCCGNSPLNFGHNLENDVGSKGARGILIYDFGFEDRRRETEETPIVRSLVPRDDCQCLK